MTELEAGWLPDFLYTGGKFQPGLAMIADRNGKILRLSREPEDLARAQRLRDKAVLPGFVNVHSHSFQRAIRGRTEHRTDAVLDTFWTWREAMYQAASMMTPEDIHAVARMAFLEMLLAGITTVGEFHYLHHSPTGQRYENANELAGQVIEAAGGVGIRIALLRTAYVRAGWGKEPNPRQARFITPHVEDFLKDTDALRSTLAEPDRVWVGIAPHSIRAVPLEYLRATVDYARANGLRIHMHVAEQPAEVEASTGEFGLRPVALLDREGILGADFTGVHAIHIDAQEIRELGNSKSHVCACPTTERNLGDGTLPADGLFNAGAQICFGSDSNAQIDSLEDARELEYNLRLKKLERAVLARDSDSEAIARVLFHSATESGASSVGSPGGALEPGRSADFFTVNLNDPSIAGAGADALLTNIVFTAGRHSIRDVFVGGKQLVKNGRHARQRGILAKFDAVQKRLWEV